MTGVQKFLTKCHRESGIGTDIKLKQGQNKNENFKMICGQFVYMTEWKEK